MLLCSVYLVERNGVIERLFGVKLDFAKGSLVGSEVAAPEEKRVGLQILRFQRDRLRCPVLTSVLMHGGENLYFGIVVLKRLPIGVFRVFHPNKVELDPKNNILGALRAKKVFFRLSNKFEIPA